MILQEFRFHILRQIQNKTNHKKTVSLKKINCFDGANNLIDLEQA
jgi:hypothetical protein